MSKLNSKQNLAMRLREARKLSGLSQAQVAKMMEWHRPTVSQIEAGERNVSAEELGEFSRIYDVSFGWLMDGPSEDALRDARVHLAARELQKLKSDDLDRLLAVIASLREEEDESD